MNRRERRIHGMKIASARVCERKAAFATKEEALAALADAAARPGFVERPGKRAHAYRCPCGDHWHNGNIPVRGLYHQGRKIA